jgi:hypothetical protein
MIYLHKVPKDLFIKHNSREWFSKPGVNEVKPIEVVTVPVDKWLHLIRQATPQDLELQKKYMKQQGVAEGITPKDIHKLADRKNVKWDNEPSFLKLTKRLTGKEHLDDLNQAGLNKVKQHLEKQGTQ